MAGTGSGMITSFTTAPIKLTPRTVPSHTLTPGTLSTTFSLVEEQRRWIVIGICLNKLLLPTLRDFIKSEMPKHYAKLEAAHNVKTQTYPTYLKKDKYNLNYGSVNNNEAKHGKKTTLYDYGVKSEVDLAKLYLAPYMAKFSGFDDSCDLSAVLGILSSASIFTPSVQSSSNDVRKDVRNEWGHCNFADWTNLKYLKCFKQMDSLVRDLKLLPAEEKRITDELANWETKGVHLCIGNMVDANLVKFVQREVVILHDEIKRLWRENENEVRTITEALRNAEEAIEKYQEETKRQLESLNKSHESISQKVEEVSDTAAALSHDVGFSKSSQAKLETKIAVVEENQEALAKRIEKGELKNENLEKRVEALESAIETRSNDRAITVFQAPNRIPCFHGRVQELHLLAGQLKEIKGPCKVTAVCGLGGTGKTSLAIEHIWEKKEAYSGGVFWISGESNSLFNISVSEMARQIGTFDEDFKTALSKTLDWLQRRQDAWCLVIDNLDELELSTDMLKLVGGHWKRQACGHILITTRREKKKLTEDIPDLIEDGGCIELKNLSQSESTEFMKKRTKRPGDADDNAIEQLVVELGCLPLALDQAAAYIKNRKEILFSDYLEEYKARKLTILKRSKAHYPAQDTSRDRIAVHTTWQLNFDYVLSEENGIGQAAALVMEVFAFLSPDDIPNEILNQGLPVVDHDDLQKCASTTLRKTDILSVLTKFSLFQTFSESSFSVHRLVQEVIRDKVKEDNRLKEVLQAASRMLHHAFANNRSPNEVCQSFQGNSVFNQDSPPSLYLWGKLGAHASVLLSYLIQSSQMCDEIRQQALYSEESLMLLNEVSVYLNVCRQIKEAMELKETKLKVLAGLKVPLTEEKVKYIYVFDIPLKDFQFKLISHCMTAHEDAAIQEKKERKTKAARKRSEGDCLRQKGNDAVKKKNYQEAANLYTAAIECIEDDPRLYSNRALCELKLQNPESALRDCQKCLELEEHNTKALMRKAWSLYELSKTDNQEKLKGRMRAAAALAVYFDSTLLKDKLFNQMFPKVEFKEIHNSSELSASFMYSVQGKTYLLHEGHYDFHSAMLDVDMQLVALKNQKVTLEFVSLGVFQSSVYAEGLIFAKGNGDIVCQQKGSLDFFKCKIAGGYSCCKDYPDCNGGPGCIADTFFGMKACDRTGKYGIAQVSGMIGTPSIRVMQGSNCNVENSDVTECGGVAIICQDKGSVLRVVSSRVYGNPQSGVEVDGGRLVATDNDFYANGFYGILISTPSGACQIANNRIYENKKDAISVNQADEKVEIVNNRIYHNFGLGIGLVSSGQVEVTQNEIFENSYYGIGAILSTTAIIEKNDIYSNKCGGVYIGRNYDGRIVVQANTIRDHNGPPWIMIEGTFSNEEVLMKGGGYLDFRKRIKPYSIPPIIAENNLKNNEEKMFHPRERLETVKRECAFCRKSESLSRCSECNVASYCNQECQKRHWEKHKALCLSLSEQYSEIVELERSDGAQVQLLMNHFHPDLKDIGKGPKPDPKSKRRFIVKIQTLHHNCHPLQNLTVYDKSLDVYGHFQSPKIFNVIMECGVLGQLLLFTSKKAFFYATFVDDAKKLKIDLAKLAPYQDSW